MRVAHNAVIDHVRKHKKANSLQDDYADIEDQPTEYDESLRLDQAAFKQQLMQVIKALDDPFRSIIIMRDIQGLSYAEIRETLEMSESQVKVYLHRGRRKLRDNEQLRKLFNASSDEPVTENSGHTSSTQKANNE